MAITKPNLPEVQPGDPITAERWNQLRQAILDLYDALGNPTPDIAVTLTDAADGSLVTQAVVRAELKASPDLNWTAQLSGESFVLVNLVPGLFTVTITANGYQPVTREVTVTRGQTAAVTVALTPIIYSVFLPDLTGKTLPEALKAIPEGLLPGLVTNEQDQAVMGPSDIVPSEYTTAKVLAQTPGGNAEVALGSSVALKVETMVVMPQVVGQPLDAVLDGLRQKQFAAIQIVDDHGHEYPAGSVPAGYMSAQILTQAPAQHQVVAAAQSTVRLKVDIARVQDVVGQPLSGVLAGLGGMRLTQGTVSNGRADLTPAEIAGLYRDAIVQTQSPAPGEYVAAGTRLHLTTPVMVKMPNVLGQTVRNVRTTLANLELTMGSFYNSEGVISEAVLNDIYLDVGISWQNLVADSVVPIGSVAHLSVPDKRKVPDLSGKLGAAKTTLANAGLTLGALQKRGGTALPETYPGAPNPDNADVYEQSPAAGAIVDPNSAVTLKLSTTVPSVGGEDGGEDCAARHLNYTSETEWTDRPTDGYYKPYVVFKSQSPSAGTVVDIGATVHAEFRQEWRQPNSGDTDGILGDLPPAETE